MCRAGLLGRQRWRPRTNNNPRKSNVHRHSFQGKFLEEKPWTAIQAGHPPFLSTGMLLLCDGLTWAGFLAQTLGLGSASHHPARALSAFLQKLRGAGLLLLLPYFFTSWGPLHHRIIVFFVVWEVPQLWKKLEDRGVSLGVGILPGSRWWQQISVMAVGEAVILLAGAGRLWGIKSTEFFSFSLGLHM